MQRVFATMLAVTCVIGSIVIDSTPGFARGAAPGIGRGAGAGIGRGMGAGIPRGMGAGIGRSRGVGIRRGAGIRPMPATRNAIPAPLSSPAQAPAINGPLNSNGLPSMGGTP